MLQNSEIFGRLTLWRLAAVGDFQKKQQHLNARGFAWEFVWSGML